MFPLSSRLDKFFFLLGLGKDLYERRMLFLFVISSSLFMLTIEFGVIKNILYTIISRFLESFFSFFLVTLERGFKQSFILFVDYVLMI